MQIHNRLRSIDPAVQELCTGTLTWKLKDVKRRSGERRQCRFWRNLCWWCCMVSIGRRRFQKVPKTKNTKQSTWFRSEGENREAEVGMVEGNLWKYGERQKKPIGSYHFPQAIFLLCQYQSSFVFCFLRRHFSFPFFFYSLKVYLLNLIFR